MNKEAIFRQHNSLLIIDHQTYWHTFATNALQIAGYQVQTLASYEDIFLELDKGHTFNLVILGCTDVAVSERLLINRLLGRHLHIIVLANTLTSEMIRALFLQGVDDAVEKTYNGARLLSYIDQAIERIAWRKQHQITENRSL